jgi:hypothetical protein
MRAAIVALGVAGAAAGPCDIFGAAGTPCVAAHSVTRALYSAYTGPLYQLRRLKDNATTDIAPIVAGGPADGKAQDAFCGAGCVIQRIYDQVRVGRGKGGGRARPTPPQQNTNTDLPLAPVVAARQQPGPGAPRRRRQAPRQARQRVAPAYDAQRAPRLRCLL